MDLTPPSPGWFWVLSELRWKHLKLLGAELMLVWFLLLGSWHPWVLGTVWTSYPSLWLEPEVHVWTQAASSDRGQFTLWGPLFTPRWTPPWSSYSGEGGSPRLPEGTMCRFLSWKLTIQMPSRLRVSWPSGFYARATGKVIGDSRGRRGPGEPPPTLPHH